MGESVNAATRRRSLASFAVLIVAALAVAGTSPAPTRAPTVQAEKTGFLELGPETTMAAVEVTVTANAALLAEATNQTRVSVSRIRADGESGEDPITAMAIELVGGSDPAAVGTAPTLSDALTAACRPAAECIRRYRISASLAGPTDGPVRVGWRVVAESRTGTDKEPGNPPPGASLTIEARRPDAVADHDTFDAVTSSEIRIDPKQPRFVRTVTVVAPPHPEANLVVALRTVIERDFPDRHPQLVSVTIGATTADDDSPMSYGYAGIQDIRVPACSDPEGCRTDLRIVGTWLGGPPDDGATIGWTLGASLFSLDPDAPIEGRLALDADDLATLPARPVGHAEGTLTTGGKNVQTRQSLAISFDSSAVTGVVNGDARNLRSGIAFMATMIASPASRSGGTKDVLMHIGSGFGDGFPGSLIELTSEVIPISCLGSTCTATIPLEAWSYEAPDGDVTVDWRIDVAFVLDPGVRVEPGVKLRFRVDDTR